MANKVLLTVSGGDRVATNSNTTNIDFQSVTINGIQIKKTGTELDFDASKLTNVAAGTATGQVLVWDQLGEASGVASLDSGGKIPAAQLPGTVMEFKGAWNANANTFPTLTDGGAAVAAAVLKQDITYQAATGGLAGNQLGIQYTPGATAGAEVVTVTPGGTTVITVQIENGVSTAAQVEAAINSFPAAVALVTPLITGTASNPQASGGAPSFLSGGQNAADNGDIYRVSVAGSQDLGSGPNTYAIGDWVMYNGSIWQKSPGSDAVMSVNGATGVVSLVTDDISEDSTPMNLWFTDARAAGATLVGYTAGSGMVAATDSVIGAIQKLDGNAADISGVANAALPSASFTDAAVTGKLITGFVGIAGTVAATDTILQAIDKLDGNVVGVTSTANAALPSASFTDTAVTGKLITGFTSGAGTVAATDTVLQAIQKLDGNVAAAGSSSAHSFTNDNAGAITIRKVAYVKSNGNIDLAKADVVATGADKTLVIVKDASIASAAAGNCYVKNDIIPGFGSALTVNLVYYVSEATAGALTATPPSATGNYVYKVGRAISGDKLLFEPEYRWSIA